MGWMSDGHESAVAREYAYMTPKPRTRVNNDEIRLSILHQLYRAKFSKNPHVLAHEFELQNVDYVDIVANLEYLLDKNLIEGDKKYTDNGEVFISYVNINAWGMDVVEDIAKRSLEKLDSSVKAELEKEANTQNVLAKLHEKFADTASVWQPFVQVANTVFSSLGHG